jgi:GxxExxY protein
MELHHKGHEGSQRGTKEGIEGLAAAVIGAALKVHSTLGPGLLESVYEECLCREFSMRGINFQRQVHVPLQYGGLALAAGLRLDLLVECDLIVEVKSVEKLAAIHDSQLLTYLRLTGKRLGLMFNFNVAHMRDGGIRRKII